MFIFFKLLNVYKFLFLLIFYPLIIKNISLTIFSCNSTTLQYVKNKNPETGSLKLNQEGEKRILRG